MPMFLNLPLCGTSTYDTDNYELAVCADFKDSTPFEKRLLLRKNWRELAAAIVADYPKAVVFVWGRPGSKPGCFMHLQIFVPRGADDFEDSGAYDALVNAGFCVDWQSRCPC